MPGVLYSGHINADDGFSAPFHFNGPPGWTVYKSNQTEIYKVTHNLHLTNPHRQLHVVVTTKEWGVDPQLGHGADSFTITMMKMPQIAPAQTDFDFVAVHYPKAK